MLIESREGVSLLERLQQVAQKVRLYKSVITEIMNTRNAQTETISAVSISTRFKWINTVIDQSGTLLRNITSSIA